MLSPLVKKSMPPETGPDKEHALACAQLRYAEQMKRKPRMFLSLQDMTALEMKASIDLAHNMKKSPQDFSSVMKDMSIALLFQKTSTRTRCSFENAAWELGAQASMIDWKSSNFMLADLRDEIRALSRFYDVIMARVNDHKTLEIMAEDSEVPVINGLCNRMHPCQALTDYMTMTEYFGTDLSGLNLTYIGDGNNVCRSLIHGAMHLGVNITLCTPAAYAMDAETVSMGGNLVSVVSDPFDAVENADVIYTDTWVSMGDEAEAATRLAAFHGFQVDQKLMAMAPKHALFMHCLPAHPGQEVTAEVLRSARSIVFDQAENRKHAQKALLALLTPKRA